MIGWKGPRTDSAGLPTLGVDARVGATMAIEASATLRALPAVYERILIRSETQGPNVKCVFNDSGALLLPRCLTPVIHPGDIFHFPENVLATGEGASVYIQRPHARRDLLFSVIDYARQECRQGRDSSGVQADVRNKALGIFSIRVRCEVLREYFYVGDRRRSWDEQPSFYELLGAEPKAARAELRVAYKLRMLELRTAHSMIDRIQSLERAFNILGQSTLRQSYDKLLLDPGFTVPFPYNGFGSLLCEGNCSQDGRTFFASQILAFRPHQSAKSIRAPLRHCTFYEDLALYRDVRRKLEVPFDRCAMPLPWDPSWNRWKHLLGVRAEIKAVFVQTGAYCYRRGAWALEKWETALPSRIEVHLPNDSAEHISKSRNNYLRFGEFADTLETVRRDVESTPLERAELQRHCSRLGIPSDFDVSLITWKPDYEKFYYEQLCRRARRVYLFRDEYIFDLETLVVVETPQLGHATYLFSKPGSMTAFLASYRLTSREDILQNRNNIAEALGFLARIIHGPNEQSWLADLRAHLGVTDEVGTS